MGMNFERGIIGLLLVSMVALAGCGKPTEPDTDPPYVEVVYPVGDSEVFGVVEIRAEAQDPSGISKVEFYIDGELAPDGVVRWPPYVYDWETAVLPESTRHTVSAKAWDEPGNSASSEVVSVVVLSPLTYTIVSTLPTPAYAANLWIEGEIAYVADYGGGLHIVDISDPENPIAVGVWDSLAYLWDVLVQGNYAYLAEEESGLLILDVSNPASPFLVGSSGQSSGGRAVSVSGDRAYMADVDSNLQIFDVSDPYAVNLERTHELNVPAYDVWASGDLVFAVTGGRVGIKVFDVSGGTPDLIGELVTPNETKGIYLEGELGYLADGGWGGLQVADLSSPGSPRMIGSCATFGYAYSCYVSGRYAYVADGAGGLVVVDALNPQYPSRIAHIDTPGFARGVFVSGNCAYIADGNEGMAVVGWSR